MWYLILNAVLTFWVCFDAFKRNEEVAPWVIGTSLLGVIVVPIYLAKRSLLEGEVREGGTAWNVLKNFAILWTIFMAFAAGQGLIAVGEHTSGLHGNAEMAGAAIGTMLGIGMLFALWFFPFVGAFIVGLMMKRSSIVEKGPSGRNIGPDGTSSSAKRIPVTPIGWGGIVVSLIFLIGFISCNMGSDSVTAQQNGEKKQISSEKKSEENQKLSESQTDQNWTYFKKPDKMGRGEIKIASTKSTNTLSFGFPYDGEQNGELTLRVHPEFGKDVMLKVEKGQFLTGIDGCNVKVRFDNGKPMTFWANPAADHTTEMVFISGYSKFVTFLKKSKKVMIEAPFYQEGNQILEFNVARLNW